MHLRTWRFENIIERNLGGFRSFFLMHFVLCRMFHILAFETMTQKRNMAVYLKHTKSTNELKVYTSKKKLYDTLNLNYTLQNFSRKINKKNEWIDFDGNIRIYETILNS